MNGVETFVLSGAPGLLNLWLTSAWEGLLLLLVLGLVFRTLKQASSAMRSYSFAAAMLLVLALPGLAWRSGPGTGSLHPAWHIERSWGLALLAVWLLLSAARGLTLAKGAFRILGLARRAQPLCPDEQMSAILGTSRRRVGVLVSDEVTRPQILGFFRPRILLPSGLVEELTASEMQHVILHELEHLRRGDDWLNLMQQMSLMLLPLNPALIWLHRRLCEEREMACDDEVLRSTGTPKAYAACLVKLAEFSMLRRGAALALSILGASSPGSELAGRVHRILRGSDQVSRPRWQQPVFGLCAGLLLVAGVAVLARSPEVVMANGSAPVVAEASKAPIPTAGRLFPAEMPARMQLTAAGESNQFRPRAVKALMTDAQVLQRSTPRIERQQNAKASLRSLRVARVPKFTSTLPVAFRQTSPRYVTRPEGRLVETNVKVLQPVYAAVRFGDGWLILQL